MYCNAETRSLLGMLWKHRAPARLEHSHRALAPGLSRYSAVFFWPPTRLSGLSFRASHRGREISPQVPCLCLGCRPGVATPAARVGAGGSGCYNVEFRVARFILLEVPMAELFPFQA